MTSRDSPGRRLPPTPGRGVQVPRHDDRYDTTSQPSYLHNLISLQPARSTRSSSVVTFLAHQPSPHYGRPLSVSGRPCYILPMFFIYYFFMAALFSGPG